jgi:hypothetical protein
MMAISLWQPWASALLVPDLKPHETRHWPCPARIIGQRVAIHAAKKVLPYDLFGENAERDEVINAAFGGPWRKTLPFGALIGTAVVASCRPMAPGLEPCAFGAVPAHDNDRLLGDWSGGRFAWRMADPIVFDTPIPTKGQQGWWDLERPAVVTGDLFAAGSAA